MVLGLSRQSQTRLSVGLVFFGVFFGSGALAKAACTGLTPCFDASSLWLPPGHAEFLSLPDTVIAAPGEPSFGFATDLMRAPVTAHVSSPDAGGRDVHVVDYAQDVELSASIAVLTRFELSATLPVRLYQTGAGAGGLTSQSSSSVASAALRDARLGVAYSFDDLMRVPGFGARAGLEASFPLGDEDAFAGERSVVLEPNATLSYRFERFAARAELGARVRQASDYGDVRLGNQGVIALGAGVDVLSRGLLFLSLEAFALPPLASNRATAANPAVTSERWLPAEWLLAVSSTLRPHGEWQLSGSFGTGLPLSNETRAGVSNDFLGLTTPTWRSILSLRFSPR